MRYAPRHARPGQPRHLPRIAVAAAAASAGLVLAFAPASAHASSGDVGARMLNAAETRLNDWYVWGGTGPSGFDCSGLVYWSAIQAGLGAGFPRDTYEMAASPRLAEIPASEVRRGDLAFWGSRGAPYHVEFVTDWHDVTFGTEDPTWQGRVTWHQWSGWTPPSFFMRVLG